MLLLASTADAEDWPQFRGPTGLGYTQSLELPIRWGGPENKQENVMWKSPLVGEGHASPIVSGGRVFVCTVRWPDSVTDRAKVIPEHHVLCYSTSDGKLVFGSAVIAALDFEGRVVWRKEITPYTFDVTIGSSPILFRDSLLMLCAMANRNDSKLLAYGKADGSIRWAAPLPETGFGHSTPVLITAGGHPQVIIVASGISESDRGVQSFDPASGELLWWCRGAGDAASIAFGAGIVYCDSGRGGPGVAIDPTGSGDVTATHIKWRINQVPEGIGSPIVVGNLVYRLHRPNVLKCWQAADGREVYAQRLDRLTSTWASPVADAAGRIFFATAGVSYVVQSGPDFQVLAMNDLSDPNHASPAVVNDRMYLVGTRFVHCVGKN